MASITDGNYLVMNQGKNPLVNFNFMLRVEMVFDLPCKSVRAFSRELEYDFIQEGGLNDYVHMLRKPISKPFTLEVERYVGVDYVDPLPLGADLVLPLLLFVSRAHSQFIPGVVARTYTFTGCTVMKKTYGDLLADQSGLLVETTTIGYREMVCVDIPWSEVGDNIFGFSAEPPAPTSAATEDKTAEELKAKGQDYYNQAKEANEQVKTDFDDTAAATLLKETERYLKTLRDSIGNGGSLAKGLEYAKAAVEKAADEAERSLHAVREKQSALNAANAAWREAIAAHQEAVQASPPVQEEIDAAQAAASTAEEKREAAEEELRAVQQTAQAAQDAANEAKRARDRAQAEYNQAAQLVSPMQNANINLTSRKKKAADAKTQCTAQHDLCKKANDQLQESPAEPLSTVSTLFEQVKKYSKATVYQRRQALEARQYMAAAEDVLANVKSALGIEDTPADTTETTGAEETPDTAAPAGTGESPATDEPAAQQ